MRGTLTIDVEVRITQSTPDPEDLLRDIKEALQSVSSKYPNNQVTFDKFILVNENGQPVLGVVRIRK